MAFNTGNPVPSTNPKDFSDNAGIVDRWTNGEAASVNDRLGVPRKTLSGMNAEFDSAQDFRSSTFASDQSDREQAFQALLLESGYQELGEYQAGVQITQLNQVVTFGDYLYRLSPSTPLPYTTSGDWDQDESDFVQIDFVTASQLAQERQQRQSADSSLQSQITEAAPIAAAERPIVQWHAQVIENSITIPDDVNAFTFGPTIEIADGQSVTVGDNSHWTISDGVPGNA